MGKVFVFDDERLIELRREISRHPLLKQRLETALAKGEKSIDIIFSLKEGDDIPVVRTFDELIGFLAAEVGILLHGSYSAEEMYQLCDKIRERLVQIRAVVINASPTANKSVH